MKKLLGLSVFGALALAMLARSGVLASLFSANYLPHRYCYLTQPGLVWTNVVSDGLIAISYAVIFSCLIWIARKLRDIPDIQGYLWIFLSFGLFIVACGATHLMEVVTVWWPVYPFSAAVKVVCMAASIPTAFLFAKATPALAKSIRNFLKMLQSTEQQRDQALVALDLSEILIAERQRSAEKLAAVNDQLNSVLECTSDSVIKISHEWVILYANGKALAGLPIFKVGEDYWSCRPPVLGTPAEQRLRAVMEEGRAEATWESSIVQSESVERWVSIGAECSNGDIHVDVTDSGPGIEDHFKAHLMEPFFTTKELGLGMGVGLSLSRAIAQDHRGSLTLRPHTEHTCFRLTLPIKGNEPNEEEEQISMGVPYQPA